MYEIKYPFNWMNIERFYKVLFFIVIAVFKMETVLNLREKRSKGGFGA